MKEFDSGSKFNSFLKNKNLSGSCVGAWAEPRSDACRSAPYVLALSLKSQFPLPPPLFWGVLFGWFFGGATPIGAQDLLLTLYSGVIPERAWNPSGVSCMQGKCLGVISPALTLFCLAL